MTPRQPGAARASGAAPGVLELGLSLAVVSAGLLAARSHPLWAAWLRVGCPLLEWTGIPCLTCGGTRAMAAVAAGHWIEALAWNPLVAVAGFAMLVWVPVCCLMIAGVLPRPSIPQQLGSGVRSAVPLLLAANWVYLLFWFRG